MLVDTLRSQLTDAMKAKDELRKNAIRVVLSESAPKDGKPATDEGVFKVIRKIVEGNNETRTMLKQAGRDNEPLYTHLDNESKYLSEFLPKTLSRDKIAEELVPLADSLKAAKSDGQAMGLAMKHFKAKGLTVDGNDVSAVVAEVRK